MVGKTISHYKILEKIGQGGMGEVYLAQDTSLDRKVALKFLPEEMQQDPTARKRFLREAKSAAALDHPYICKIYEVGEAEGKDFIAMEYVEGQTLKETLVQGPLALKQVLQRGSEIAEALEEAHKKNIVHRDLKPSNIMLTEQGHVKVMDFGLAKQLIPAEGIGSQEQTISASLTKTGATLGTLAYMSPEQLRGEEVDTRSDIFSFGIVLYEMLTSVDPFKKPQPMDTASSILKEDPPPLSRYLNEVPALLQHTVRKMLAKELDRRFQSIHEVRTDLGDLISDIAESSTTQAGIDSFAAPAREVGVPVVERSWRQMVPWLVACAVATVIITLIVVWVLSPPPTPRPLTRFAMVLPPTQQLWGAGRHLVALSPDGKHLVYVANGQLYLRAMDQLEATPIRGTQEGGGRSPFFSPDGQWVGFWAGGQLKKISISGGAPVILCEAQIPWGACWGADDRILFGQGPEGIFQVPAKGGTKELLISVDSEKNESAHGPQVLPGGKAVLFTLGSVRNWDEAKIVVQSLETGVRQLLINGGRDARYVPTGHLVYAREGTLLAVPFDLARLEVTGGPVPIIEGVRQAIADSTGAAQFTFSGLGSLVYVPGTGESNNTLVWVDREGQEEPLAAEPRPYRWPRLSPDGTRLAITIDDSGNEDVWIYDLRRNTPTRLTFDPASDRNSLWTPDGLRVVFRSEREGGQPNLFSKAADGTGQVERLTTSPNLQYPYSFSPDGKRLAFMEINPETSYDVHVLSMEGERSSKPLLHTPFYENRPAISPDGRWIAYVSDESGQWEVIVRPFPNVEEGTWQISREGGVSPVWGPKGRELFYRSLSGDAMMVVGVETKPTFTSTIPEVLFTGTYFTWSGPQYDISTDGQRFLMLKGGEQTGDTRQEIILVQNWFEELKRLVPTGK